MSKNNANSNHKSNNKLDNKSDSKNKSNNKPDSKIGLDNNINNNYKPKNKVDSNNKPNNKPKSNNKLDNKRDGPNSSLFSLLLNQNIFKNLQLGLFDELYIGIDIKNLKMHCIIAKQYNDNHQADSLNYELFHY